MTSRFRLARATGALLLLGSVSIIGACGHRPDKAASITPVPDVVTLTDRDEGKTITVRPDATVVVRLPDPGGGRHWDYLWEAGHQFLRPLPPAPGPGGADALRFALIPPDYSTQERLYCLAPAHGPNWLRGACLWHVTLVNAPGEPGTPPEGLGPSPPLGSPPDARCRSGRATSVRDAGQCYQRTPVPVEPGAVVTAQLSQEDLICYVWDPRDTSLRPLTDSAAHTPCGGHTTDFTFRFSVGRAIRGRTERLRFVRGYLGTTASATRTLKSLSCTDDDAGPMRITCSEASASWTGGDV